MIFFSSCLIFGLNYPTVVTHTEQTIATEMYRSLCHFVLNVKTMTILRFHKKLGAMFANLGEPGSKTFYYDRRDIIKELDQTGVFSCVCESWKSLSCYFQLGKKHWRRFSKSREESTLDVHRWRPFWPTLI